jgi:pimeloyl-ACP methyl ester carboxylesterase
MMDALPDIPAAGETPLDCVARIAASACVEHTPCGDGVVVWRIWGAGPPLVLLHGGHGAWSHWIRNIPVLSQYFTLYVPDLPGYGESDMPPEPRDGIAIARAVSEGIDQLLPSDRSYDVAGFSFGGIVGGRVAVEQGARLRRLVVVGSSGLGLPRVKMPRLCKWTPDMPEKELRDVHFHNLSIIMFADVSKIDELALYLQTMNTLRARNRGSAIARSDLLRRSLPDIAGRVLCLTGEHDIYVKANLEARKQLFRAVQPDTPFETIAGAGHWAMYEAPGAFNAALLAMLGPKGGVARP